MTLQNQDGLQKAFAAANQNFNIAKAPEIFETGEYEDKFYYLAKFYNGRTIATKYPPNTSGLDKWLDRIVELNIFLLSLADFDLPLDKTKKSYSEDWDSYEQKLRPSSRPRFGRP